MAQPSHSNGNAPSESVDLELEHDLHNASTLLASQKRNGVRKKVSYNKNIIFRWFVYWENVKLFLLLYF